MVSVSFLSLLSYQEIWRVVQGEQQPIVSTQQEVKQECTRAGINPSPIVNRLDQNLTYRGASSHTRRSRGYACVLVPVALNQSESEQMLYC